MIKMRVRVDNAYLLTWDKKKARQTHRRAAAEILANARRLVRKGGGGGRRYYVEGGRYVASAAGQPPVSLTGALRRSGRASVFRSGTGFSVRFSAFWALILEQGARGGAGSSRGKAFALRGARSGPGGRRIAAGTRELEPRPFLSRAAEDAWPSIHDRMVAAIYDGIEFRRSGKRK